MTPLFKFKVWQWCLSLVGGHHPVSVPLPLLLIEAPAQHHGDYSTSSTNSSLVSVFILYAGTGPSVALSLLLVERSAHRLSSHRLFCHPRIQVNENSEVPKKSNVKLWSSFSLVGSFLSKHFQLLGGNWLSFWDLSFWWNFLLGEYLSKGAHTKSHTFLHWSRQQGWSWSVSSLSYSGHPSLWWSTPTFGDAQHGQRWTIRIFGWFLQYFSGWGYVLQCLPEQEWWLGSYATIMVSLNWRLVWRGWSPTLFRYFYSALPRALLSSLLLLPAAPLLDK